MPNVMICGYDRETAIQLRRRINLCLQQAGYRDAGITCIVPLEAQSCNGLSTDMPFLRLMATDALDFERIIQVFVQYGIIEDIECVKLHRFVSRKQMQPPPVR